MKLPIFFLAAAASNGAPSSAPTEAPTPIQALYEPGNLDTFELDLHLSAGMTAKVIARAGEPVAYADGSTSSEPFHTLPDGAAVFPNDSTGGWVYVSNSEAEDNNGGVGAIQFDADGSIVDYRMLLTGTNRNCNGGKTDWNTWITCEEPVNSDGKVYEVDPFGVREPVQIPLGSQGGAWEAFAHDTRDPTTVYAFLTEDSVDGALQRMTIENPDYNNTHEILPQGGAVDYLLLEPLSFFEQTSGTFQWIAEEAEARTNAALYYPNTEDLELIDDTLCVVSKLKKGFFHLNLTDLTYTFEAVGFAGQPDQSTTVFQDDGSKLVYFTEEANPVLGFLGAQVGVWTRDEAGNYTHILFGDDYSSETTGIDFSPDGMHLYFAYQDDGILFDVTRTDGLSFFARTAPSSGIQPTGESPADGQTFWELVEDGLNDVADWLF